jgi:hypothetical protein
LFGFYVTHSAGRSCRGSGPATQRRPAFGWLAGGPASGVWAAKMAGRMAKAKGAHDTVVAAALRAQADAREIAAGAERRLANEYDGAQERGEVRGHGNKSDITNKNITSATVKEIGVTSKRIHEARKVRDAEKADPGIVRRTLDKLLAEGKEPTKAALNRAIRKAAAKRKDTADNGPTQDVGNDGTADADRWERSLGNVAGDAISIRAFWAKTFGKEWEKFHVPSTAVTLAEQAAKEWTELAADLTKRRKALAEQEERDRKTCISLDAKATGAERELAQWLLDHPGYSGADVAGWRDAPLN